jgi:hypothetical protein
VEARQGRPAPIEQALWFVFQGHDSLIDIATLHATVGRPERAMPWLAQATAQLDRYQRQGIVGHAFDFHRARLLALQGQEALALVSLEKAVSGGSRRGWWLRRDPALSRLQGSPRFAALLERIDGDMQRQRSRLTG